MYIGAWTEYRLALEKQRRCKASAASAGSCDHGGRRKGGGIYHPSLSEMGGMEVASLPDRESFRKTLECALCSNLAADDAEQITRALEPLLQRLPTICAREPVPRCRPTRRVRCASRCSKTRSEGARSATISSSDGVGSVHSGFSISSAPMTTAGFVGISGTRVRRYNTGGMVKLPRIAHTRETLRAITTNGVCTRQRRRFQRPKISAVDGARSNSKNRPECWRTGASDGMERGVELATTATTAVPSIGCDSAKLNRNYDSDKATALLRIARRRDPVGIKADFQQFWTWKTHGDDRGGGGVAESCDQNSSVNRHHPPETTPSKRRDSSASGQCISGRARSRLDVLERMKKVYMARRETRALITSDAKAGVGDVPTSSQKLLHQSPLSQPTETSSANMLKHRAEIDSVDSSGVDREGTSASAGSSDTIVDTGMTGEVCNGETDTSYEPMVTVPDLKLTESRMRQVDKYFGGEVWRRQNADSRNDHSHFGVDEAGVLNLQGSASAIGSSERPINAPMDCEGDICSRRSTDSDDRGMSGTSSSGSFGYSDGCEIERSAGLRSVSSDRRDCHASVPGAERINGADAPTRVEETQVDEAMTSPPKNSLAPLGSPGSERCNSVPVPAPAWYGDTLEDLVCWTEQLDFSTVEGY